MQQEDKPVSKHRYRYLFHTGIFSSSGHAGIYREI